RHPGVDLRAVTTVNGDTARRAAVAAKLVALAGRDDVEVAAGLEGPPPPDGRVASTGREGQGLLEPGEQVAFSDRDAVTVLLEATRDAAGCAIATVGMQTNLAAAVSRDPSLAQRVRRLAVMGGAFAPIDDHGAAASPALDHNLNVDPQGALVALSAGLATRYVPIDVTLRTFLTRVQLELLRRGDALCRALASLTDVWTPVLHARGGGRIPADHAAVLHDPLTVWAAVEDRHLDVTTLPVTVARHGGDVRTFIDPAAGTPAEVVTAVDAPAFAEALVEVLLA
ncbi:MAG: nucleoside hydrolase, partial [Euzebyales bacterium]|nr:nucleoside hydrolase [Euzebyales bacterium]